MRTQVLFSFLNLQVRQACIQSCDLLLYVRMHVHPSGRTCPELCLSLHLFFCWFVALPKNYKTTRDRTIELALKMCTVRSLALGLLTVLVFHSCYAGDSEPALPVVINTWPFTEATAEGSCSMLVTCVEGVCGVIVCIQVPLFTCCTYVRTQAQQAHLDAR